jgi:hypothetical protein
MWVNSLLQVSAFLKYHHQVFKHDPAEMPNVVESGEEWELYIVTGGMMVGKLQSDGAHHSVISRPSCCLLQYTAPILLCFPKHWASQQDHIWLPDDGILWMLKHVGDYWIPIQWMLNEFLGFSFTLRKCMVQNEKSWFKLMTLKMKLQFTQIHCLI